MLNLALLKALGDRADPRFPFLPNMVLLLSAPGSSSNLNNYLSKFRIPASQYRLLFPCLAKFTSRPVNFSSSRTGAILQIAPLIMLKSASLPS